MAHLYCYRNGRLVIDDDAIRALLAFVKEIDEALPDLKPCTQQECI